MELGWAFTYNQIHLEQQFPFNILAWQIWDLFMIENVEHWYVGWTKTNHPDFLQQMLEKVRTIWKRTKIAQSRQKIYTDHRRQELTFKVHNFVFVEYLHQKEWWDPERKEDWVYLPIYDPLLSGGRAFSISLNTLAIIDP